MNLRKSEKPKAKAATIRMMHNKQFNGLLLVDKPSGISSHDVVARLRRILGTKAVGHSGTLDPMASGLMACLINEGTKLSQYILEGDKGYRVRAQWRRAHGYFRYDGHCFRNKTCGSFSRSCFAKSFAIAGEMELEVPIYSAIKIQGKKLYEYAREEEAVVLPKKVMKFWDVTPVEIGPDWAEFDIKCTKGSYIRTWVDILGKNLGCGGAMSALRRTWSSPYLLPQAQTLEAIEASVKEGIWGEAFVPMESALPMVKRIRIKGQDRVLLGNGQISHDLRSQLITAFKPSEDQYIQILAQDGGQVLALVGIEPGRGFVLRRVFKY